ncbi:MAG: ABC transporter permease, partial [bacterium]
MITIWQDFRYGIRMLRKSPGFTAIALITLAIGIGANTIMFSITDMLILRPLGVKEPEQLVCCGISDMLIDYFAYLTISDSNQALSDFMAQDEGRSVTLTGQDMTAKVDTMFVSGNYFSFLGVVPAIGRGFLPEEDRQDAAPAVVLSYRLWQRQGADPAILGQSLRINGVPCQVVGVAPDGFTGTTMAGPDLWLPMGSYLSTMVLSRGESRPPEKWRAAEYPLPVILVGRLKPGVSLASAQASLQPVAARLKAQFPRNWTPRSSLYLYPAPRIGPMYTSALGFSAILRANERSQ